MAEFIKLKNAHKRVQEAFRNGMRQRRSDDYTLTQKGVNLPHVGKGELITLIVEEHYLT